jgi:ABC-2 type transport system permease protein
LRYFIIVVRGVFLQGAGIDLLWQQMAAMTVLGLIMLTLAVLRFHKHLG